MSLLMSDETMDKLVEMCAGERRRYSFGECTALADAILQLVPEVRRLRRLVEP